MPRERQELASLHHYSSARAWSEPVPAHFSSLSFADQLQTQIQHADGVDNRGVWVSVCSKPSLMWWCRHSHSQAWSQGPPGLQNTASGQRGCLEKLFSCCSALLCPSCKGSHSPSNSRGRSWGRATRAAGFYILHRRLADTCNHSPQHSSHTTRSSDIKKSLVCGNVTA